MTTATKQTPGSATAGNKGDLFSSYDPADFPVPRAKDEEWRFVPMRELRGLHNGKFDEPGEAAIDVDAPGNVTVEKVAGDDPRVTTTGAPTDRPAAQAWASADGVTLVTIPKNAALEEPVTITVRGNGQTAFGNVAIVAEQAAEATVLLRYIGGGTYADNVVFDLHDAARVSVVTDADWDEDAVHLSQHRAAVRRDAVLRHTVAIFGGRLVRIIPRVQFREQGGEVEMLGVYFADDGQYFETRLLVDHKHPNCKSNVLYKGALQGDPESDKPDTRTTWVGDVLIRREAENTDTYETNKNLVLSEAARAEAIPNLEIETGEIVGAGHAATVGRFDDEELFYLMSRGIPEVEARRLIIRGFFLDVINRIPARDIREELEERIVGELARVQTV